MLTTVARFMVGMLPLWHVLWLENYLFGPLYDWKVSVVARFLVGKFHYRSFYVWLATIMAHLWMVSHDFDPF